MAYKIIPMGDFSLEARAQMMAGFVMMAMKAQKSKPQTVKTKNKALLAKIAKQQKQETE